MRRASATLAFTAAAAMLWSFETKTSAAPAGATGARPVSPARPGHCENPQWSRDGRNLAYERVFLEDRKIELDVLTDAVTGAKERKIEVPREAIGDGLAARAASRFRRGDRAPVAPGDVCRELSWGPASDPDIFAHACNVTGGSYQLFWSEGSRLTRGRGSAGQPALSPVGWRLAYVSASAGAEGLALIDDLMESKRPRPLVRSEGRVDRLPVWGPKGRALAFVGHDDKGADLYLIKDILEAEKTLVRLTDWPDDELNPSFSPDGGRIAFFSNRGKARGRRAGYDLYVIDYAENRGPLRVAQNVALNEKRGPTWTPDGRQIVFVKDYQKGRRVDPLRAVAVRSGAQEIRLKTQTVSNRDPVVGELDGRWWLAFTSLGYWNAKKLAWRRVFLFPVDRLKKSGPSPDALE